MHEYVVYPDNGMPFPNESNKILTYATAYMNLEIIRFFERSKM